MNQLWSSHTVLSKVPKIVMGDCDIPFQEDDRIIEVFEESHIVTLDGDSINGVNDIVSILWYVGGPRSDYIHISLTRMSAVDTVNPVLASWVSDRLQSVEPCSVIAVG